MSGHLRGNGLIPYIQSFLILQLLSSLESRTLASVWFKTISFLSLLVLSFQPAAFIHFVKFWFFTFCENIEQLLYSLNNSDLADSLLYCTTVLT